jgi:hypothetical protein
MIFDFPFHRKPDRSETAALRDRALIAETQVLLLRDIVEHPRRRREPRRDKQSVIDAKKDTTAKLQRLVDAQRFAELEPKLFAGMRVSRDGMGKAT